MSVKTVLGLDLARKLGYAWMKTNEMRDNVGGVEELTNTKASLGEKCLAFKIWIAEQLDWRTPDFVSYEAPIMHSVNKHGAGLINSLEGVLLCELEYRGISYAAVYPSTVKKLVTGSGRAKKPEVIAAVKKRFPMAEVKDDNHADAIAVALWAIEQVEGL